MATAMKGHRMTPKGPGGLGKWGDILQAHSTRKGFHYAHCPQVDGCHRMCPLSKSTARGGTRAGKRDLILTPKIVGLEREPSC